MLLGRSSRGAGPPAWAGTVLLAAGIALGPAGPARAADEVVTVIIREQRFEPAVLTVKPGTTVRWVNEEKRTTHSVLLLGEGGFESERLFPGETWQHRFDRPGRHAYTCGPHPEMRGIVDVRP